ncbi:MAG: WecB/TagA/CpsF family glycosyltransferase, partial [Armatimonadota bacterium]|nr:WecB/TagA/CpsF family glycosyltransferase [Armatimonadota bacterium]
VVSRIAASGADVLLVALGIPKQEKFIARNLDRLGVSVAIGVGGTLDVFSGRVKRAPRLIQRLNLEWLYRLMCNPRKISKVKRLPVLVLMTLRAARRAGSGRDAR